MPDYEGSQLPTRSKITLRLLVDLSDQAEATAFEQTIRDRLAAFADITRSQTQPYWKIPEWFELFVVAEPVATASPTLVFKRILLLLGEGWEQHDVGDEEQWAVWNPKPGCTFCSQQVRWANVELFPKPEQAH